MNKIKYIYIVFMLTGGLLMTSCSNFLDIQPTGKVIPNTLEEYRALITTAYAQTSADGSLCDMRTGDITIRNDNQDQVTMAILKSGLLTIPPVSNLPGALITKIFIMLML